MSNTVKGTLGLLCLTTLASSCTVAGEPARPIRALLIAGGCCHDYARQIGFITQGLSRRADIRWTVAYDPDKTDHHRNPVYDNPDWAANFDVIVHDECSSYVNDRDVIETVLRPHKAGLPAVVLHCGMHSYRTDGWDRQVATPWMRFTGLISTGHGPQKPIAITFVDNGHPITKDLVDWTTVDEELYNNASGKLESTAHALAAGTQVYTRFPVKDGKEDRTAAGRQVTDRAIVAWTNIYNDKTRVFSTTLGHNNATVEDPRYLDLVARGLLWSLGRLDAEHPKAGPVSKAAPTPITVPLKALATNPNYFTDGTGKAVYLTGSHTWNTFQDWGTDGTIRPLDFGMFVRMLVKHHHNFTLLWATELPSFHGLPTTATSPPDFDVTPQPWLRTGPGNASDGKPKFDLTKFDQPYFDRLRDRVQQLREAGIYAGVYLFSGEWLLRFRFPGDGYPLGGSNNVNGIDDGGGTRSVTMTAPNEITRIQDAYAKKVIDTLSDLPNVLWIVSQEAPSNSTWWNSHLIALVRSYEAGKPLQHPIGYGALDGQKNDDVLVNSDADWIAPSVRISPTSTRGTGNPRRKVNVNDSDHSYFGIWNDSAQVNRNYFWINFTQGNQTIFMDPYVVYYPRENRNLCPSPVHGIGSGPDPRWDNVRDTMGFIRRYADRMNLAATTPRGDLSSTGHALVGTSAAETEVLAYAPSGGAFDVNLLNFGGRFAVEWMNPATGETSAGADVEGGTRRTFEPPFSGDAVLYLKSMSPAAPQR